MPFLLMFWKPIAGVLLAIALIAALGLTKHHYDERRRDEGRSEVQAKWDAAIQAQQAREAKAAAEADDFQRRADAKREADFKHQLAGRTPAVLARLSADPVSGTIVSELRNTVRTTNEQGTGKPEVGVSAPAGSSDGRSITEWFSVVGEQYRKCRDHEVAWLKWDDERVAP